MKRQCECTIFSDEEMNESGSVYHFVTYYPYRIQGMKNPDFDKNSGLILDFKEGKEQALEWAYGLVHPWLNKDFAICIVPSHEAGKTESPLIDFTELIVNSDSSRIDASHCLVRHTTIPKLARGGDREIQVHLNSIRVEDKTLIKGEQVLLLDDVRTTGNSLEACMQLLRSAGARLVRAISIAQTDG